VSYNTCTVLTTVYTFSVSNPTFLVTGGLPMKAGDESLPWSLKSCDKFCFSFGDIVFLREKSGDDLKNIIYRRENKLTCDLRMGNPLVQSVILDI